MPERKGNLVQSTVEKIALEKSNQKLKYEPTEKIGVVIVDNFPELGRLTALRFFEWAQENPGGLISLPTGKTPEYFIREVHRFLNSWDQKDAQKELEEGGVDPKKRPDLQSLWFAQIDEFYPIDPNQHNSFYYYVNRFYIQKFRLDPNKALLINCAKIGIPPGKELQDVWTNYKVDLSLRYRQARNLQERLQKQVLESVDQWCMEYEQRIRELGGIGFFLGGIGPDGHIGFNIMGSDLHSTTRLTPTNYETQAAAATDLGGIEVSKRRLVITIGLSTIVYNPNCTAIIMAAGEAKANVVAEAIQKTRHIRYPATVLQELPNARFYLTQGSARQLWERRLRVLTSSEEIGDEQIEKIIIDIALERRKCIEKLTQEDFKKNRFGSVLLKKLHAQVKESTQKVKMRLVQKIKKGMTIRKNLVFLHTEPHHDDIMLGYLPFVVRHTRESSNQHSFVALTSGFTAVTNQYMLDLLVKLKHFIDRGIFDRLFDEGYFQPNNTIAKSRDVWQYLDGVAADSRMMKSEAQLRRLLRNLVLIHEENHFENLKERINELIHYFESQYPGKKDLTHIQQLKGMCREWESDCLWGYFGWHSDSVYHLRLGFYRGDIFTEEPTVERDVLPIVQILRKTKPDVLTLAFDPEASGPDTHYKVLQTITEALKMYQKEYDCSNMEILGYRNVWYRFHPSEVDIMVPVSLNMFALQDNAFKNSFVSQKDASFPSHEYDGPFSELARKIQVEQYQMLKTCLGREFFNEHPNALVRATRGIVFLKSMGLNEFYRYSRELKKSTENV